MILRQFERYDGFRNIIAIGHFNKFEAQELKMNGYHETWTEKKFVQRNKHGIPIQNIKVDA